MSSRRVWALVALLLAVAAVALAIAVTVSGFPRGLSVIACVVLAALAAWYAVRRGGLARRVGGAAAALLR